MGLALRWSVSSLISMMMGISFAHADDNAYWLAYPFVQPPSARLVAAGLVTNSNVQSSTLSVSTSLHTPSAVTQAQPIPPRSPIVQSHPLYPLAEPSWWTHPFRLHPNTVQHQFPYYHSAPKPWYETALGVAGIGVATTGVTMLFDHGINNYADNHISYGFRKNVALNFADILTDSSLIFMGTTWFQSPWASAKLAHASSVALTATAITTVEVFALKYSTGRARPLGPNSNSLDFHPFSSQYALFDTSFIFRGGTGNTSSFPSGHTAIAFSVITPYAQIYHMPWLYTIPVAVGISRIIAVNGHWASDVVAGGFIGWLTADLTNRFFPKSNYGFIFFGDGAGMYGHF